MGRPHVRLETLAATLEQPVDDEAAILDVLVSAAAKGHAHPELWSALHEAAARDERQAELAFAYERLAQDRRLKVLAPAVQAEIVMHAATFFADVFGDADGATGYLERVLALVPGHAAAFAKLESVLVASEQLLRLADLYGATAPHRPDKGEQLALLRKAAELVDTFSGEQERAIRLGQQILKLDPTDASARRGLEARLRQAGKLHDAAKLLEQVLAAEPPPDEDEALAIRERLLSTYGAELAEPERALPHIEAILAIDPVHQGARQAAERLLSHKSVAARVATALADVHERMHAPAEAAAMLAIVLDNLRGPKRLEVQRRLAVLKLDRLGDESGAWGLLESIIGMDPADREIRARYRAASAKLGRRADAARVLARAAASAKEPALKATLGLDVAEVYLEAGDEKRARVAFQGVIDAGTDDASVVAAARSLARLHAAANEHRPLATVLELLARVEPDPEERASAAERVARLASDELRDRERAAAAWRSLLGGPREDAALVELERLYEAAGATDGLVEVLERRAKRTNDASLSRELSVRAAELLSTHGGERGRALAAWRNVVESYGPSREAHARLLPLLEQERAYEELSRVLEREIELTPDAERAAIFARLGIVRMTRLGDARGGLEAFGRALALDPSDKVARQAVEKLLASGEHRLAAAAWMEPIYRAEGSVSGLVKVLEARAELSGDVETRLAALGEAVEVLEGDPKERRRAIELSARALGKAVAASHASAGAWMVRIERLTAGAEPSRRATAFAEALGDREVDSPLLFELAQRAGAALVEAGDVSRALATYRRALAWAPTSAELIARVDALLKEQGSPEERVALYRAALLQPCEPKRRRDLLHAIGVLERRELGNLEGAIATYRLALAEDPDDETAFEALCEAHEAGRSFDALYEELAAAATRSDGERRAALCERMAEASVAAGETGRALRHYRELLTGSAATERVLAAVERLAAEVSDVAALREVLELRVRLASEPPEETAALERLGALLAEARDASAAAHAYRRAAALAEGALADEERARGFYERVLSLDGADRHAAERLVALYETARQYERVPEAYDVLLRTASDAREAAELALAFEPHAVRAGVLDRLIEAIDAALERGATDRTAGAAAFAMYGPELLAAKARALVADPSRRDEAAAIHRGLVEAAGATDGPAVAAFEAFLAASPSSDARNDDRRWLFAFRAEHAADDEKIRTLLAWAAAERGPLARPHAAVEILRRVLAIDADRADALETLARLSLELGDVPDGIEALRALRDRSEGEARAALELEIAGLLLDRLERPDEALDAIAPVLDASPTDADALAVVVRALSSSARFRAASILERAAAAAEDAERADAILTMLLETPVDAPELRDARRRSYERLVERNAAAPEAALALALRGAEELLDDEPLWDAAERLAKELERPEPVAEAYARALGRTLAPQVAETIGRRAVDHREEWFDDGEAVLRLLARVLELAPKASWAFDRLKLAYASSERWGELFALYDAALGGDLDERARADLLDEAAQTAKDFAGEPDRAIAYLEQLLAIRAGDARIVASLERLYERQRRTRPLIDLLSIQLAALDGDAAQRMRARIASLYVVDLGDDRAAFELVERMLAEEPERPEAFDLLERIIALPPPVGSIPPGFVGEEPSTSGGSKKKGRPKKKAPLTVRQQAASLLKRRLVAEGRSHELVLVLEVELETVADRKERIERLAELVAIRVERLDDAEGAFEHAAALVGLERGAPERRALLRELAARSGRFARQAEVLVATAEACTDSKLRVEVLLEAAEVVRDRLDDVPRAIELFARAFELAGGDRRSAAAAGRALAPLLERAERWEERCALLERLAELEDDGAARRALLGEVARIASRRLADPDRAVRALRARLADDPADAEALDALVATLEPAGRFHDLAEALARRAELAADSERARLDRVRRARLLADELDAKADAIEAWRAIRAAFGADEESFDELSRLLETTGRHEEHAMLLEAEVANAPAERRVALLRTLGEIAARRLSQLERAARSFASALAIDPRDAGSRDGLRSLLDSPGQRGTALAALARAYVESEDWAPAAALAAQLGTDEDVPETIARGFFWNVALHHRDVEGDAVGAEAAFDRALAHDPGSVEILGALVPLRRRAGGRRLIDALLGLSNALGGDVGLLREATETALGPLADDVLGEPIAANLLDAAVARWTGEGLDPDARSSFEQAAAFALERLASVARRRGDQAAVVALLLRGAELPFERADKRRRLREAAELAATALGDVDRAIDLYTRIFAEDPTDGIAVESVERFAELLAERDRDADVVALWEGQARWREEAGEHARAAELWTRAAELAETRLGDEERAIEAHRRGADIGGRASLEALARLHGRRGEHARAAEVLERLWERPGTEGLESHALRLAEAYVHAGSREVARARLEHAAGIVRDPSLVRGRLAEMYREDEAWGPLAALIAVQAGESPDSATRIARLREAADLHVARRGDPQAAIPLLEQAVALDPDDASLRLVLAAALGAAKRFDDAVAILRAQVERYGARRPKERALVHFELARVALAAGDRPRALAELDVAAKIDQTHPEILHTLGRLAREEKQLDRAQRTYRALLLLVRRSSDDQPAAISRAQVLLELSDIAFEQGDAERSSEFLESALEAARESRRDDARLEAALRERGRFDVLARTLTARLAATTDPFEGAVALAELVEAYDTIGHTAEIDARLCGKAAEIFRTLERLGAPDERAYAALETAYAKLGDAESRARVLERVLASATGERRTDGLYRLAALELAHQSTRERGVDRLAQAMEAELRPTEAEAALAAAFEREPRDERALRLLERVARASGRETVLVDALARLAALGGDRSAELREAVELSRRLGDHERAESIVRRALAEGELSAPMAVWGRGILAALRREAGDLAEAVRLLEAAAADAPPDEARALLLEAAKLAAGPLDDLPRAARTYEVLFAREPADRAVWEPLLDVYRRQGNVSDLATLIERTVPLVESSEERAKLRLEQANVMLADPAKVDAAAELLREALDDDPRQLEAAIQLSGILERAGRFDELADLLASQLDGAKDREDAASIVSLSMRLATLLEQRGRAMDALEILHVALDWMPASRDVLRAILRVSDHRGDPWEIADVLERLVAVETGEAAAASALRLASLRREQGDEAAAERALAAGLDAHPASVEVREELLSRFAARGAWGEIAGVLRRGLEADPDDRAILRRLLAAHRKHGEFEGAVEVVTAALERAPNDAWLFHERSTLLEALGREDEALEDVARACACGEGRYVSELVAALERGIERAAAPDDRALKLRLAGVLADSGVPGAARGHLADLLKRDPKDRDALRALARLEDADGRWDAASTAYRRLLPLEEGDALVEAALGLARACEQAGRSGDARSGLERALRVAPGHDVVRERLYAVYEATGAHRELAQLVLERAQAAPDVAGRCDGLLRAGELLLGRDGDPIQAVPVLEEARSLRPEDERGTLLLARAYATVARHTDALALLDQAIAAHKGRRSTALSLLLRERAKVLLAAGDLTDTLATLAKAFDMDHHDAELALEVGELARELGEVELSTRAFRTLTLMKPSEAPGLLKGRAYHALADVAREAGDLRRARLMAEKAVLEDAANEEARALLDWLKGAQ